MTSTVVSMLGSRTDQKPWLDEELWEDFKIHRQQMKQPLTAIAEKRLLAKLEKAHREGMDVEAALETSIECGWRGVFPKPPQVPEAVPEFNKPRVTRAEIERFARPGETYEQAETRLKRERGIT